MNQLRTSTGVAARSSTWQRASMNPLKGATAMRKPIGEAKRLAALRRYRIVDTPADRAFDDITAFLATLCNAPIALIGLIERDRVWLKSHHGTRVTEIPRDQRIGEHEIATGEPLMTSDLAADPRCSRSRLVTGTDGWRSYFGVPICDDEGVALGVLAVVDVMPRTLSDLQRQGLQMFARQVERLLELHRLQQAKPTVTRAARSTSDEPVESFEVEAAEAGASATDGSAVEADTESVTGNGAGETPVRRRVLVVDDIEAAATSLGRVLDAMGHETRIAHDGPRALSIAKEFHPDVIL